MVSLVGLAVSNFVVDVAHDNVSGGCDAVATPVTRSLGQARPRIGRQCEPVSAA
jgi:hypothetical protein